MTPEHGVSCRAPGTPGGRARHSASHGCGDPDLVRHAIGDTAQTIPIAAFPCAPAGVAGGNASKFKLPLSTAFLDWTAGYPVQSLQTRGELPFAAVASGFSFMSCAAHAIILICFTRYAADLRRGINRFRWIEYAFSSSLMIGLIAMLFGVYDVLTLTALMSVNACMNLFGLCQEELTVTRAELAAATKTGPPVVDWTPFACGCFAGVVPWAIILAGILGIAPDQRSRVPGFVWALVVIYFLMFNCFAVNMALQLRGASCAQSSGRWEGRGEGPVGVSRCIVHCHRAVTPLRSLLL